MDLPRRYEYRLHSVPTAQHELAPLNRLGAQGWRVAATLVHTPGGSVGHTRTSSLLLEREVHATARVRGIVSDRLGRPVAAAGVAAFARDLREEQSLGQTTTDSEGRYEIGYNPSDRTDLLVRVFDAQGHVRAESPIILSARPDETVLLRVNGD